MSLRQALSIWEEFVECWNSTNRHGGDTAEIYAHRLAERNPTANETLGGSMSARALREQAEEVAENLAVLLRHFVATHEGAKIKVGGVRFVGTVEPFEHRVHVEILRPREKR